MSNVYEKYFGGGDISAGKAGMMGDIRDHALKGGELRELIGELERRGMLNTKRYAPPPKEQWDRAYLDKLSHGYISDYFSREFLEHFGEAAKYVCGQAKRKKYISAGVILLALALAIGCWLLSSGGNGKEPPTDSPNIQSNQS